MRAPYSRLDIANAILARLDDATLEQARKDFADSRVTKWFVVDDLLPRDMALAIRNAFPDPSQMRERKTLREHKHVSSQMDKHNPLAEEALFAFQDDRVVEAVGRITGLQALLPDPKLYAGGLSLMTRGNFLNPHLDNSHNHDRTQYRVLNLLYYVSPEWDVSSGGHLELWPQGVKHTPRTIHSFFNRLAVMTTGPDSWHSVSSVKSAMPRCCVSNYYFSPQPLAGSPYFRVTSFRGRPEQPWRDLYLRADAVIRRAVRSIFPSGMTKTTHIYEGNKKNSQ
jgi:Rps23 Pro-64 3,4-dihydroxylase Tpa1-like proline 4-hydroxylase